MNPLLIREWPEAAIERRLLYGSLPGIQIPDYKNSDREKDLETYVETYLEEEVRAEALVKNLGIFARFLEFAALESGKIVSFRKISQELGIGHPTVSAYFQLKLYLGKKYQEL